MAKYYTDPSTGQRVQIEKTHKFRNFVVFPALGVIAVAIIATAANGSAGTAPTGNGPAVAPAAETGHTVRYEVTGSGSAMITHTTDGNLSMSQSTQNVPFSTDIKFDKAFYTPLSLTATRSYQGGTGPLTCKIIVDGKTITENHSGGGEFSTVSCNGHM